MINKLNIEEKSSRQKLTSGEFNSLINVVNGLPIGYNETVTTLTNNMVITHNMDAITRFASFLDENNNPIDLNWEYIDLNSIRMTHGITLNNIKINLLLW